LSGRNIWTTAAERRRAAERKAYSELSEILRKYDNDEPNDTSLTQWRRVNMNNIFKDIESRRSSARFSYANRSHLNRQRNVWTTAAERRRAAEWLNN
jgi:flagellar biosynthesis chaperone FliJ